MAPCRGWWSKMSLKKCSIGWQCLRLYTFRRSRFLSSLFEHLVEFHILSYFNIELTSIVSSVSLVIESS